MLLSGDIHNKRQESDAALPTAGDEDCDVSAQVGDLWPQDTTWQGFAPDQAAAVQLRGQCRDSGWWSWTAPTKRGHA